MTPDPLLRLQGDVRAALGRLAEKSIHCVITSPPYWGLRAYGTPPQVWGGDPACPHEWADATVHNSRHRDDSTAGELQKSSAGSVGHRGVRAGAVCRCGAWKGELGQEPTPQLFVAHLVEVFAAVWRVLRDDGTLWLNLGDTYCTHPHGPPGANASDPKWVGARDRGRPESGVAVNRQKLPGVKHKDRLLMPPRVALALQEWGWYVRDEIVWSKPNPMPASSRDRTSPAHEMVYLLSKKPHYFFDQVAIQEPAVTAGRIAGGRKAGSAEAHRAAGRKPGNGNNGTGQLQHSPVGPTRNPRSVWTVATHPYRAAHFATFPPRLVRRMVLAGTSAEGVCPACGAPRVRVVEKVRRPTRPGEQTKLKVPGGWDVSTGRGGHGTVHREGRTSATYRDTAEVGNRDRRRHVTDYTTVGWAWSCECHPADPAAAAGAVILDPFGGSGVTAAVALELSRRAVLVELSPDYQDLQAARLTQHLTRTRGPLYVPAIPAPIVV